MVSAVALALYTLMPVKVLAKWGSLMVTGFAMLFGGLVLVPVVQPWVVPVDITPAFLIILAAVIVVGTCAAYMLYLQGINDCGPVKAGLLCAAEPVSAMVISVLWLHTPVSTWDIAGCACILVMIVMVTEFEPKREGGESALELAGVETAPLPQDSAGVRRSRFGARLLQQQARDHGGHCPRGGAPGRRPSSVC